MERSHVRVVAINQSSNYIKDELSERDGRTGWKIKMDLCDGGNTDARQSDGAYAISPVIFHVQPWKMFNIRQLSPSEVDKDLSY